MVRKVVAASVALLVLVGTFSIASPARSITKAEVDEACAASREAYQDYLAAKGRADVVTGELAEIRGRVETALAKDVTLRAQVDEYQAEIRDMRESVLDRAVDLYMAGGQSFTGVFFVANDVSQVIAGQEMLASAAEEDIGSIDRLNALSANTLELQEELKATRVDLEDLEGEIAERYDIIYTLLEQAEEKRSELSSECRSAQAEYEAELARRRALEAARRAGAAGGLPSNATPGFICPMTSTHSFINDWGFPRSGGRSHKGTDLFAPMGQPLQAVASGTVRTGNGGLGGITVWINSDYGVNFYYAHLSALGPGIQTGARVDKGDIVGYNGDTGNARGGRPHLHFGIWVSNWVNPYPTLSRNC
jgi:murein DD-endopeptidase MepM/ murein hydrolase activator NlpD